MILFKNRASMVPLLLGSILLSSHLYSKPVVPLPYNPGSPLNSPQEDFAQSISADGKTMVFNSKRDGQKYADIYISTYNKGEWMPPVRMNILNSPYNDETPHISMNGNLIIFSSDRDGSTEMQKDRYGRIRVSSDLYWSRNERDKWTRPIRVAGAVNTMHHEKTPSLSPDGKILYFTRWGFGNSRGSVLMHSRLGPGGFGKGSPLPAPFNTGHRDTGLIHAKDGFYFSSNREGGYGGFDIYFMPFEKGVFGKPINLGPIINSESNELYYSKNSNGGYFCSNRPGGLGHFDIYRAGFNIHAIHFDYDSATIKPESHKLLDSIVNFMKEHKYLKFQIVGHTDLHGTDEYNNRLSLQRAESVKKYLTSKRLDESRFSTRGAGKTEPLTSRKGPEFDEKNRRTEFRIFGLKH